MRGTTPTNRPSTHVWCKRSPTYFPTSPTQTGPASLVANFPSFVGCHLFHKLLRGYDKEAGVFVLVGSDEGLVRCDNDVTAGVEGHVIERIVLKVPAEVGASMLEGKEVNGLKVEMVDDVQELAGKGGAVNLSKNVCGVNHAL